MNKKVLAQHGKSIYLAITRVCNQHCLYCPCGKLPSPGESETAEFFLKLDDVKKILAAYKQNAEVCDATISGGEPTTNPELGKIVTFLQNSSITVTILTNAELFCQEVLLQSMQDDGVDFSKLNIITTLHSESAFEHETANGKQGSFKKSITGLQKLIKYGVNVTVKHCLTRRNFQSLVNFYNYVDVTFPIKVDVQLCSIDYAGIPMEKRKAECLSFLELKPYLEAMFEECIRKDNGRRVYAINMPLCSCDPYYWNFIVKGKLDYALYSDPVIGQELHTHGELAKGFRQGQANAGTRAPVCEFCEAQKICPGTYFTAFESFGNRIVKPYRKNSGPQIRPEFFMIDMTNACNFQCAYCFRNVNKQGSQHISDEKLKNICDYIIRYCNETPNIKNISLQPWGGEPLLRYEQIIFMAKYLKPRSTKVHFIIETNGLLLTKDRVKELHDLGINLGISIDGPAFIHDKQRLKSTSDKNLQASSKDVVKAIQMVQKEYKNNFGIISILTRNSLGHIEEMLDYFDTELKIRSVKFNFVHLSTFSPKSEELSLSLAETANCVKEMFYKQVSMVRQGSNLREGNLVVKMRNLLGDFPLDNCLQSGCCGGRKMIAFSMDGGIYPCELTDYQDMRMGEVLSNQNLLNVVKNALEDPNNSAHAYFVPKMKEECDKCKWYAFCGGGCTVKLITSGKKPPCVEETECMINRTLYPLLAQLLRDEPDIALKLAGR